MYVCVCFLTHSHSHSPFFSLVVLRVHTHCCYCSPRVVLPSPPTNAFASCISTPPTAPSHRAAHEEVFAAPAGIRSVILCALVHHPSLCPPPAWCLRVLSCCSVCCSVCWCHLGLFNASHPDLYPNTSSPLPPTASWVQHRPSLSSRAESRATLRGVSACFVIFFFGGGAERSAKECLLSVCLWVWSLLRHACVYHELRSIKTKPARPPM